MPGTGKSFTICVLIEVLMRLKKKVLITCYTHVALDLIIDRFLAMYPQHKQRVVRMTPSTQDSSQRVKDITFQRRNLNNLEEVDEFVDKKFLFFTTAMSTSDPIIQSIKFDYAVCDESS